jgi:organic radical activating enzyme
MSTAQNMNEITSFLEAARQGEQTDAAPFVDFSKKFEAIVLWGAGNLGTALGAKLIELGVRIDVYWDTQFEQIKERNGLRVIQPFSGDFKPQKTLVIFCIGNIVTGSQIMGTLGKNAYHNVVHGKDLLYAFLCPLTNQYPPKPEICNSLAICEICSCERLYSIIQADAARARGVPKKEILSLTRFYITITTACNLKCTHCTMYMNSYPKKIAKNVPLRQILQDINIVMQAIDACGIVCLYGGEPFLHKDIDKIIEQTLTYENFNSLLLSTNGSVPMTSRHLEAMNSPRIRLDLSNYLHIYNDKQRKIFFNNLEKCKIAGIFVKSQNFIPTWIMASTLEDKHKTPEMMRQSKNSCKKDNGRLIVGHNGKLFPCFFAQSLFSLGVADYPDDYIELNPEHSISEIRERIQKMISRPWHLSCSHCQFDNPTLPSAKAVKTIVNQAAEQGFNSRYSLPVHKAISA